MALLSTRIELLGLEAQDLADTLLGRLALMLATACFWLLALGTATVALAAQFWASDYRVLVLALLALAYALIGLACLLYLRYRLHHAVSPFASTLSVLAKDLQALHPEEQGDTTEPHEE